MQEIRSGMWSWSAPLEKIQTDVSSHYIVDEKVLIDPIVPAEGLEWFEQHGCPEHILLTTSNHDRHAWQFSEKFGCRVHAPSGGADEISDRGAVEGFAPGDELPGGAKAYAAGGVHPA